VISRRRICVVAILAVALVAPGCVLGKSHRQQKSTPADAPWNPMKRQTADAATTFLFDPVVARTQSPGKGGFIMGDATTGDVPWRSTSKVVVVPGRYRQGVQSTNSAGGYLWMPSTGILSTTAFTIEFWAKSAVAFNAVGGQTPVTVSGVGFTFSHGTLQATFANGDVDPPRTTTVAASVRSVPANTWTNFALTYANRQLILFINGKPVARRDGVAAPQVWSDASRGGGLTVAGGNGHGAPAFAVSDLRISRVARVPGRRLGSVPSTLEITTANTGSRVRQSLLGGLHSLTTPATERQANGVIKVIRIDKLINSTPIKVGAPDAAHRSAGVTGSFSYDWEVVDRTVEYLRGLGIRPYVSLDATPEVLGGKVPPFSNPLLHTARSDRAAFSTMVPDNLQAWQQIVHDLVYRVLVQDKVPVAYWGVWNEPDGAFWAGTLGQYLALYQATVSGIRAVAPGAVVGGAETVGLDLQWVDALMSFCASHHLPLDFISWHYYSGDLDDIPQAQASVASLARRYRMAEPFLAIGEWAWQLANAPGTGALPFRNENYFVNDWSAAFVGASLIEMQRHGVRSSIYTNAVASLGEKGFRASGLMSNSAPWSNFNVYVLWHDLGGRVVRTSLNADPGVFAIASKNRRNLAALIVSLHYQLGKSYGLTLQFPRRLAAKKVRVWLIDRKHADAYDAGPQRARLHPSSHVLSRRATLRLSLAARAVVLVDAPLG
jgi:hypothetical protein